MKKVFLFALLFLLAFSTTMHAHSGRTDSRGGHNCSQKSKEKGLCTGYHYHNGGSSSSASNSGSKSSSQSSTSTNTSTASHKTSTEKKYSESGATIFINEIQVNLNPKPILINNSNYLPLRKTAELLGAQVEWKPETQSITITKDTIVFKLKVNSQEAVLNDKSIKINAVPVVINNSVFVSLRTITEGLGASVNYVSSTDTIYIAS